jgi:ferredoxin-NADP reductase
MSYNANIIHIYKGYIMSDHKVQVQSTNKVTHNVLRIVTEKPSSYDFTPGQATEIAINRDEWAQEKRPFTFTSLPEDDYLEFIIKTYPDHKGVTGELLKIQNGDELILGDVFGEIAYKGEGVFIAGGAGITPFISIFRDLQKKNIIGENKLIFANNTKADIILEYELQDILKRNFVNILSEEKLKGYAHGHITREFLQPYISDADKKIYLCGPPPMMEAVEGFLKEMNIQEDRVIKEGF